MQLRGYGFDPWSGKTPRATEQLSPCTTTTEPVLESMQAANNWAHMLQLLKPEYLEPVVRNEKPAHRDKE